MKGKAALRLALNLISSARTLVALDCPEVGQKCPGFYISGDFNPFLVVCPLAQVPNPPLRLVFRFAWSARVRETRHELVRVGGEGR
jgi:hypothetical protein